MKLNDYASWSTSHTTIGKLNYLIDSFNSQENKNGSYGQ